jgi:hypothetical protein
MKARGGARRRLQRRDQKYASLDLDPAAADTIDYVVEVSYQVVEEHVGLDGVRVIDRVQVLSVGLHAGKRAPRAGHTAPLRGTVRADRRTPVGGTVS